MLVPGQDVTLKIDKPAAGGRMIARLNGQVILVSGAIPGEIVSARIERIGKGVAYATTAAVEEPSVHRRTLFTDPLCGGCLYDHIAYPRQLVIKGQVIADAFARIGRLPLGADPIVARSHPEGYRMRARLHVRGRRHGFFREGTHDICDARGTRQLLPATCDALDRVVTALQAAGCGEAGEIEVSENVDASDRVVHVETIDPCALAEWPEIEGVTGLTLATRGGRLQPDRTPAGQVRLKPDPTSDVIPTSAVVVASGDPYVTDVLTIDQQTVSLRRHVLSFFQGNRYLLRDLIAHVVGAIDVGSSVVDLYAGVGVFAVAAAVVRNARVTAVEGDAAAARDLAENATVAGGGIECVHQDVESFGARSRPSPDVAIVDPPRTGMSNEALQGVIRLRARRILYVSCDVATLARDSRKLVDAGYLIQQVNAFDLFPNTPHVETVVRFEDGGM